MIRHVLRFLPAINLCHNLIKTWAITWTQIWFYKPVKLRAVVLSLALSVPALAQVDITDIQVNISAESGLKAREQGIADARRKAFQALLQANPHLAEKLEGRTLPSDQDLEQATETFEVQKEKISAKRYIGTLTITFSATGIDRILSGDFKNSPSQVQQMQSDETKTTSSDSAKDSDANAKQTVDRDVILVPLFVTPDESHLWTKNSWREFWQHIPHDVAKADGLMTTIPLGDLQDILATSIEDLMVNRAQNVQNLIKRYGKSTLLFVSLRRFADEGYDFELSIKIFRNNTVVFSSQPISLSAESDQGAFAAARTEAIKTLQDFESSAATIQNTAIQTFVIEARFSSFMQWQAIKRALKNPDIKSFSITNLTRKSARIRLKSSTSSANLQMALNNQGLQLQESVPGRYQLFVQTAQQ